jgi:hypothetical protein
VRIGQNAPTLSVNSTLPTLWGLVYVGNVEFTAPGFARA